MNPIQFLIVGAAKSGTTSLYQYINQHDLVFMPENKEPRFFCDYPIESFDFKNKYFHSNITKTPEQYCALFDNAPPGSFCGEASTDYLACPGTAQRIYDWDSQIKIIIMLRNPIERAYSEYMHSFNAKFQRCSFWESLQLEEQRKAELYDPVFFHVTRGLYFQPVQEYQQLFDTKVIFFEDFVNDTASVTQETIEFLGLPKQVIDTSTAFNTGTNQYYLEKPLSSTQHEWLVEQFSDDVTQLQRMLGRDLQHWLK